MSNPPPSSGASGPTLRVKTPRFAHHNVAFSPFFEDKIATASGANFGLVGNGRLHILQMGPGGLQVVKWFDTQDCVYDVAWNECHENQVIAGCGNGSLKLFDTTLNDFPIKAWHEHSAEIMSVDWSNIQKDTFASSSWDHTVKIWRLSRVTSMATIPAHQGQAYAAQWSPRQSDTIATCGQDGFLHVFDLRAQEMRPMSSVKVSETDLLSCDWNKYDSLLATGGKDSTITIWDTRQMARPVGQLGGHALAVRKVAWSPHHRDVIASTSYDMTCRTWNTSTRSERRVHHDHTEFTMGCAWALFERDLIADCSWDEEVHVYRA
ncbi:WD40-repeat-containing domain protein [Kockovaella imperatae]|uniref:Peroxin-7 n=1 Tax=Kockovaella imperatae TaxID=4999 RepID=A0A1Y1UAJ9_9TREE|nr:WD40-repeat-containing domain protein [Kockovaella imperatae]ORX35068.1 WD40-repeat-containing domain protein [Kockovaella imperatae]